MIDTTGTGTDAVAEGSGAGETEVVTAGGSPDPVGLAGWVAMYPPPPAMTAIAVIIVAPRSQGPSRVSASAVAPGVAPPIGNSSANASARRASCCLPLSSQPAP